MKVNRKLKVIVLANPCQVTSRLEKALALEPVDGVQESMPSSELTKLPKELEGFSVVCAVDTPSARLAHLLTLAKEGKAGEAIGNAVAGLSDEQAIEKLIELSADKESDWRLLPQKTWLTGTAVTYLSPAVLARFANANKLRANLSARPTADAWMSSALKEKCEKAYAVDSKRLKTLVMWNGDNREAFTAYGECLPCKQKQAKAKAEK
jgi:hypothetical protein